MSVDSDPTNSADSDSEDLHLDDFDIHKSAKNVLMLDENRYPVPREPRVDGMHLLVQP